MFPILALTGLDWFSELFHTVLSIFGFGCIALVFWLGGLVTTWINGIGEGITDTLNLGMQKSRVNLVLKLLVAVAAFVMASRAMPSFREVVDSMMPSASFDEITGAMADREGRFLINVLFNVVLEQIALNFAYFIPFILVNLVIGFLNKFLSDPWDDSTVLETILLYAADLVALYAVNACVLQQGKVFGWIMLQFLRSVRLSAGLVPFLLMLVAFVMMFFYVVQGLVTSDVLLAVLGVNIAAAVMQVWIGDHNRVWILALAIGCSLVSKVLRRICPADNFTVEAIFGLTALAGTSLISCLVFFLIR